MIMLVQDTGSVPQKHRPVIDLTLENPNITNEEANELLRLLTLNTGFPELMTEEWKRRIEQLIAKGGWKSNE